MRAFKLLILLSVLVLGSFSFAQNKQRGQVSFSYCYSFNDTNRVVVDASYYLWDVYVYDVSLTSMSVFGGYFSEFDANFTSTVSSGWHAGFRLTILFGALYPEWGRNWTEGVQFDSCKVFFGVNYPIFWNEVR